jgi:hypothetical protein
MSIEKKLYNIYNFKVNKILIQLLFFLFFSSYSYACSLLQVPIGTPVNEAKNTFNFLEGHNSEMYGTEISAKYSTIAFDYCEGSNLETADLEVIIYDSKVAAINISTSNSDSKNEIYTFAKNFISDPGEEVMNENWLGYKDISIGDLIMVYSKMTLRGEIYEVLEITNTDMMDHTIDENVEEVTG